MGLFDRFRAKAPQNVSNFGSGQQKVYNALSRIWQRAPDVRQKNYPELYHTSPRFAPIRVISRIVGDTEWKLCDKKDYRLNGDEAKPIEEHELYDLIDNPMADIIEIDGHRLFELTSAFYELTGEAFWIKARALSGKIVEIYPVPAAWVQATPTTTTPYFLVYPYGTTSNQVLRIDPRDMVWFKNIDMSDPYARGRGTAEVIGDEVETDELAGKYTKNFFYNDGTPPIAITAPGASQEQIAALKDSWMARVGGWMNARKPAFLNWEGANILKLNDSTREMDFIESRKFLRDSTIQNYQIPPEVFGILENSNRSTIDAADFHMSKNVIAPRLKFFERTINRQLVWPDYDKNLVMHFDEVVQEDEAFRLQVANEGVSRGMLTRAEWRRAMGYKVEKTDDVYVIPFSLTEIPKGEPIAKPEPAQPEPAQPPEPPEPPVEEVEPEKQYIIEIQKTLDPRKVAMWKMFDAKAASGEAGFTGAVSKYADRQKLKFMSTIFEVLKAHGVSPSEAVETAFKAAFGESSDEALKRGLAPAWLQSMKDGAAIAWDALGVKPDFTLLNPRFNEWVDKFGLEKAKQINETTATELRDKLKDTISASIEAGSSVDDMAKSIQKTVDDVYYRMTDSRAKLIARTETATSVNNGQWATYKSEGVEKKEWLATLDGDTRPAHASADGQVKGIDEPFEVGGEYIMFPGDGNLAENNCNCRCTIIPVIGE